MVLYFWIIETLKMYTGSWFLKQAAEITVQLITFNMPWCKIIIFCDIQNLGSVDIRREIFKEDVLSHIQFSLCYFFPQWLFDV